MAEKTRQPVRYAERMFPEPNPPGQPEADRASCSVRHGTSSYQDGGGGEGEEWFHGGGTVGELVRSPAGAGVIAAFRARGKAAHGQPGERWRVLVDAAVRVLASPAAAAAAPAIVAEAQVAVGGYGRGEQCLGHDLG